MSFWADFFEGLKGKDPLTVVNERHAREREAARLQLGQLAVSEAELQAYLGSEVARYRQIVDAERARGNGSHPYVEMTDAWLGQCRAVIRFNMNGHRGRVDISYGGSGNNPLRNQDHGHIVLFDYGARMESWLEPGREGQRNQLY
jgi:hypothetical protein